MFEVGACGFKNSNTWHSQMISSLQDGHIVDLPIINGHTWFPTLLHLNPVFLPPLNLQPRLL